MSERRKQLERDKVSRLVNWGHWFAFFNGLLAMLIGTRYISSVGAPDSLISWGYLILNTLGHFTFLAFIVYIVFIFPVSLLLPYSKILRGYAALISSLSLYLLLYDTVVFDDYGVHLSPFSFDLAWQDLNALLHSTSYIITPIAIVLVELTAANYIWKRIQKIEKKQLGNKVVLFIGTCFVASHLIHIWADAANYTNITKFDDAYPISYPATAKSFMEERGIEAADADLDYDISKSKITYPIEPLQCQADTKPNVLIVAIDSLRQDMFDSTTMPFLTQYAQSATQFTRHYAGGTTFDTSMFTLLYGLQGNYSDKKDFDYLSPVLSQQYKQHGYELALFSGREQQQFSLTGATFNDFALKLSSHEDAADSDIANIEQLTAWQKSQTKPWFAILNLSSPKEYSTPAGFLGIETIKAPASLKGAQKVLFNQYRQSLYFIDSQLKQLLTELPSDTVVVITGTHGQIFSSDMMEARRDLSPANVKVPLIIADGRTGKINHRTSHYGIAPTLLNTVLGCTTPSKQYSAGRSLFEPNSESWVYIGDSRVFAIYQKNEITVLGRYGKYRIYDITYENRLRKKMRAPELIQVMREGRRFYNH